ncbi:hypothetical protein RISK_004344 [Rhodopirellula islandica]|uniref:Uncharacterized protein n=1 Tax=Rhodopirellula islandica TaxID=595434 RepID=A0A0J1BAR4_RHOIS|nr:hypothetical protein RISK_004344 [Rhodopirellula islandica]
MVGRLALFQSIGWVPGDDLAYVDGFTRMMDSPEFRDPNSGESGYG